MKLAVSPCVTCGESITQRPGSGRIKLYCSTSCRLTQPRAPVGPLRECQGCGCAMNGSRANRPGYCRDCRSKGKSRERPILERTCKCGVAFTTSHAKQVYCSRSCRPGGKQTTCERGYGPTHQRARREWQLLVEAGLDCCLCGTPIQPGNPWHLDHDEDRTGYRGAAHPSCNLQDGQRRSALTILAKHYGVDRDALLRWLEGQGHSQSLAS